MANQSQEEIEEQYEDEEEEETHEKRKLSTHLKRTVRQRVAESKVGHVSQTITVSSNKTTN